VLLCGLLQLVACGAKNPIEPDPPPPPGQLVMSCPAEIVREATTPQGTDVHFESPSPTGGRAPYNVQCEPGSSSVFPVGETTVRCTARDVDMLQAACSFAVRVSRPLSRTKFLAFGDSITAGAISLAPLRMLDGPETYPFKLEQMLLQRSPPQAFVVHNRGFGGEDTRGGAERLPSKIKETNPQVVLLLEGINNVNGLTTDRQVTALRTMIRDAQRLDVEVIIATVMPVTPTFSQYRSTTIAKIQELNARIVQLANDEGLGPVVDLYSLFEMNIHLIGRDGVHPTAEGQTRIAEAFRDEILRRYDGRATMSPRLSTMGSAR